MTRTLAIILSVILLSTAGVAMESNEINNENIMGFTDWKPITTEEQEVCNWLGTTKAMIGYPDGRFGPWELVTTTQVVRVCNRLGITQADENSIESTPATMGWIQDTFLSGTVFSAQSYEFCTRYRFATMCYRFCTANKSWPVVTNISNDDLGKRAVTLNRWFETQTWNGKQNRFVGLGHVFVEESIRHNVPVQLALACAWAESCWGAADNPNYNMAFGIRATPEKWGEIRGLVIRGFGDYVTMEECIRAYFRYMDGQTNSKGEPLYRRYIDSGDWKSIINIYAPSYENDTNEMYQIYMTVKRWCNEHGVTW